MSEKVARVKLMLGPASFLGGLQQVTQKVQEAGKEWGKALRGPMEKGLEASKESLKETAGQIRSLAGAALGIAGGFSSAAMVSSAVSLEGKYRDLAFELEQATGEATKWQDVQRKIEPAADAVGRTSLEMIGAFEALRQKSGDAAYSAEALGVVGEAMNATGKSGEQLGSIVGTLRKKWGISDMGQVKTALLQVFEATKGGKIKFEELAEDLDELGSIAGSAGMGGMAGFTKSLGLATAIAPSVNQSISEVLTGMDQLTEKMRQMPVVKGLAESGKFAGKSFFDEFTAQPDAMKRVGMMLEKAGKKSALASFMRTATEEEFTGREERAAFKALADPFKVAYESAKASGKSADEATKAGLEAFEANISSLGQTTAKWDSIQTRAADNQNQTSAKLRQAQEIFQRAFTDPKTMKAMGELADKLPAVADGLAKLVSITVDNPLLVAGGVVGGRAALSGAGEFAGNVFGGLSKSAIGAVFGTVASQGDGAAKGLGEVAGKSGLIKKAFDALASASGLEGVAGKGAAAASSAVALLAVGAAAYSATTELLKMRDASEQKGARTANDIYFDTNKRMGEAKTPEERAKILKDSEQKLADSVGLFSSPEAATKSIKALRSDKENMDIKALSAGASVFEETMSRSGDNTGRALERAAQSAEKVARAFDRIAAPSGSNGLPPQASKAPGFWD